MAKGPRKGALCWHGTLKIFLSALPTCGGTLHHEPISMHLPIVCSTKALPIG